MLSMEFIKNEEKTYQQEIKDLEQQVNFYRNKSQRLEKKSKVLNDNWNELKKFVQEELKEAEDDFAQEDFIKVLDRMQELKGNND